MLKPLLVFLISFVLIQSNAQWNDPEQKEMNADARKGVHGSFIQFLLQ